MESLKDSAFEAVANADRREVLERLLHGSGPVEVQEGEEEKMIVLTHNHLPKLADAGCVEYTHNVNSLTIERGPRWDEFEPVVRFAVEEYNPV